MGFKAPMDSALSINPVYFPDRFLKLREYYVKRAADDDFDESVGNDFTDWYRFEGLCMGAYYALLMTQIFEPLQVVFILICLPLSSFEVPHKEKGRREQRERSSAKSDSHEDGGE